MSHEDAFIQSILETPDDDAPRLIFADWLDDRGESERAAFIRAQCRLATLDEDDPARDDLLRDEAAYLPRAREMLEAPERPPWLAKIPDWATKALGYERGFPARLDATTSQFAEAAEALAAVVPLQHLRVEFSYLSRVYDLLECPALRRMRTLTVRGDFGGTGALVGSSQVTGLTRLVLSAIHLTHSAATAVVASQKLAGLRHLDLSHNAVRDEGAAAVAESPHLANLESLNLAEAKVGRRGVKAIARSRTLGKLRHLNLAGATVREIAGALAVSDRLAALERLDLSGAAMPPDGVRALLTAKGLPRLKRLRIGCCPWPDFLWDVEPAERLRGGVALCLPQLPLAAGMADSPLLAACRELEVLSGAWDVFWELARSDAVGGLPRLRLEHIEASDSFAEMARSPRFASLRDLSLVSCTLAEKDVAALLEVSFIRQLTRLDLSHTQLTERSVRLFAQTDALAGVRELGLWGEASPGVLAQLREKYGPRLAIW